MTYIKPSSTAARLTCYYFSHHSWIRLVAPFLLILAAGSSSLHTEVVASPQESDRDHYAGAISHQYQEQRFLSQQQQERRQRRRTQNTPTVDELLDSAIASETPCTLNENGFYGNPTGGNIVATANYLYQISVVPGTTTSQLQDVVLPELDRALPTAVLPVFFPECNSNTINIFGGQSRRQLQSANERRILAISMMPTDVLVVDGQSK